MNKLFLCFLLLFTLPTMGAKYYVNLNTNHDYAKDGLTSANAFGGAIGLQRFVDTCAAGDSCLVYGYGDQRKIQWLSFATVSDTWARGDTVDNATRLGTAVVYQDSASLRLLVEVQSGSFVDGDSIYSRSLVADGILNATPTMPGIVIYKTNATFDAPITIIGVNSSWVNDGSRDTLDCYYVSGLTQIHVGKNAGLKSFYNIHNICFYRCAYYGIISTTLFDAFGWQLHNCHFNGTGDQLVRGLSSAWFNQCGASGTGNSAFVYCIFSSWNDCFTNGQKNALFICGGSASQCVMSGRGGTSGYGAYNYNSTYYLTLTNCVIDSFAVGFFVDQGYNNTALNCKFTNNVVASISVATGNRCKEAKNIFIDNGNSNQILEAGTGKCVHGGGSVYSGTIGYTDKANNDFSPTISATGRRVKTNIGVK